MFHVDYDSVIISYLHGSERLVYSESFLVFCINLLGVCYQVKSFRIFLFQVIRETQRSWCGWFVAGELSMQLFSLNVILSFNQHKIDCIEGICSANKPSTSSNDRLPLFYNISCPCLIECRFQIICSSINLHYCYSLLSCLQSLVCCTDMSQNSNNHKLQPSLISCSCTLSAYHKNPSLGCRRLCEYANYRQLGHEGETCIFLLLSLKSPVIAFSAS